MDLTQDRMYATVVDTEEVVTRVESGRQVIEPHMLLLAGGDASQLWSRERFTSRAPEEQLRRTAAALAFEAVSTEADGLFENVDFSVLE